jgi:GDPmannose 4,6-dehydratase
LRGETFVTRKITRAAAAIKLGLQDCLYLGNLDAIRDWGHAGDYVETMWLMLQQEQTDDYVLATGQATSVRDFTLWAFEEAGRPIRFTGTGGVERGVCEASGQTLVAIDPRYFRPTKVDSLIGDPSKAQERLGWRHTTEVRDSVQEMVRADLILMAREGLPGAVPSVPVD